MRKIPSRRKRRHYLPVLGAMLLAALAFPTAPASAQVQEQAQDQGPAFAFRARSYINPFPQTDRYHLHVIGDFLGTGLASGLEEAFAQDGTLKIVNSTRPSAGLARPDRTSWAADIEELSKTQPIHIAVIMMGVNDVRNIRTDGGTIARWGTEEWRTAYGDEVDKLIKALKDKGVAIYWVGLPVMANAKTNEAMALMNDIIRERTYISGAKFVDSWNGFTDQLGAFSAYGPDLTGQSKRLREPDGTSFTARGNRKLANYVEINLRRDLAAARSERNIPLAGDDAEQSSLVPKADAAAAAEPAQSPSGKTVAQLDDAAGEPPVQGATPLPPGSPGAVVLAPAGPQTPPPAANAFASGYAPPGETILGDVSEGVTGLATVSPMTDLNANFGERRLPVTERLYYKALVKGEALKPKPSRADDFKWPRS